MAFFSWFSREKSRDSDASGPARPKPRKFAAAAIVPGSDACCNAVREIAWKRFLSTQVPMIPLRDCGLPSCGCTYRRYPDRRQENRRAAAENIGTTGSNRMIRPQGDRRSPTSPGRRATDSVAI
jgi:hypothetical protein